MSYQELRDIFQVRFLQGSFGGYVEKSAKEIVMGIVQGIPTAGVMIASKGIVPASRGIMLNLNCHKSYSTRASCSLAVASDLFENYSHLACYVDGVMRIPNELLDVLNNKHSAERAEAELLLFGSSFDKFLVSNQKAIEDILEAARCIRLEVGMIVPCSVPVDGGVADSVLEITSVETDREVSGFLHIVDDVSLQPGTELIHTVVDELGQEYSCKVGIVTHVDETRQVDAAYLHRRYDISASSK